MSKCTEKKRAVAIACHPDDIEFMMAGTLLRLRDAGYEIHYFNVANGSLGSATMGRDEAVATRRSEAMASARLAGAVYHESICDDLEVFYNYELVGKVLAVVREIDPEIILTHGPYDYMEDHVNTGRLAVSAAFCRGMGNYKCKCDFPPTFRDVALYHSMPHSLTDPLRRPVVPELYVDISGVLEEKKNMLRCHRSQKEWLDASQGNDAYIEELDFRGKYHGKMSGKYVYAEGWIRHNPLGFCAPDFDPISCIL